MIPYITEMFYLTPKRVLLLLQAKEPKSGTVKNLFFLKSANLVRMFHSIDFMTTV